MKYTRHSTRRLSASKRYVEIVDMIDNMVRNDVAEERQKIAEKLRLAVIFYATQAEAEVE